MANVVIKRETKEETILREYRHLRLVIAEERQKVKYFENQMNQARDKIKYKLGVIKANEAKMAKLRKEAAKIMAEMLGEDDE